jgi:hypothetical protein
MLDRPVALAWIRDQAISPDLDPALELFASATGFEDPVEGLEWAARIENDELRERATVNIGRIWFSQDRESAEAWLSSADLPAAWKQRIETDARRRRAHSSPE